MGSRPRATRPTSVALVGVASLHAALFLLLSRTLAPAPVTEAPLARVVPVYLVQTRRDARPPKPVRAPPRVLAVRPRPDIDLPPIPAVQAPPAAEPAAAPAEGAAERARLAGALRASRVGCANPALLTARERARCEDRLAAGASSEKYIPTPLPSERRAYYDAVAKAKQPFHAEPMRPGENPVPLPSAGHDSGLAAVAMKNEKFNIPLAGCKVSFGGPGAGVVRPAHGLKLGPLPCYIVPPQGPFTVEANIKNPDKVVKKKPE